MSFLGHAIRWMGLGLAITGLASQVIGAENAPLGHPPLKPLPKPPLKVHPWTASPQGESAAHSNSQPANSQPDDPSDYFEAIRPSQKGYLIWSGDSVRVYVEPIDLVNGEVLSQGGQGSWLKAVEGAIADWSQYVSITRTEDPSQAQIQILRRQPPLSWPIQNSRARNAETQFKFFEATDASGSPCWFHRQTIFLGDRQGEAQLEGTARHELGHALGLWGHSPNPNDALYAQQVGHPPAISLRDLNTLRRVYQQPTQLGCQ